MKHFSILAVAASLALLAPVTTYAQDPNGGRGGFNYEEFRKRMNDRMKEALKATDEEWTVLQPMIEKVSDKSREVRGSRSFGGPGGPPGSSSGGDRSRSGSSSSSRYSGSSSSTPEATALRETLEKESASPSEIKARLEAVRAQRKRSQMELDAAREDLRKVLTVRQEAVLVAYGLLE